MLTADQVLDLAEKNNIRATSHWESTSQGFRPPKRRSISLWFNEVRPEAWEILLATPTEIPVEIIGGTRQVTGSGSTDGMLYPEYRAIIARVNEKRAAIGLKAVHG